MCFSANDTNKEAVYSKWSGPWRIPDQYYRFRYIFPVFDLFIDHLELMDWLLVRRTRKGGRQHWSWRSVVSDVRVGFRFFESFYQEAGLDQHVDVDG